jgi:hypothetical protein
MRAGPGVVCRRGNGWQDRRGPPRCWLSASCRTHKKPTADAGLVGAQPRMTRHGVARNSPQWTILARGITVSVDRLALALTWIAGIGLPTVTSRELRCPRPRPRTDKAGPINLVGLPGHAQRWSCADLGLGVDPRALGGSPPHARTVLLLARGPGSLWGRPPEGHGASRRRTARPAQSPRRVAHRLADTVATGIERSVHHLQQIRCTPLPRTGATS